MQCSGPCWVGSSGVDSDVSYLRLAEVLIDRLRPVLPVRMVMRIATVAEVAEMNARHARFNLGHRFPVYRHDPTAPTSSSTPISSTSG